VNEHTQAISDWLQTYDWDSFCTITFKRPRRDTIAALRDVGEFLAGDDGVYKRAFLTAEPFRYQRNLHIHAMASSVRLWKPVRNHDIEAVARHKFGISQISSIRGIDNASAYCAKYASKWSDGDNYDFFGEW